MNINFINGDPKGVPPLELPKEVISSSSHLVHGSECFTKKKKKSKKSKESHVVGEVSVREINGGSNIESEGIKVGSSVETLLSRVECASTVEVGRHASNTRESLEARGVHVEGGGSFFKTTSSAVHNRGKKGVSNGVRSGENDRSDALLAGSDRGEGNTCRPPNPTGPVTADVARDVGVEPRSVAVFSRSGVDVNESAGDSGSYPVVSGVNGRPPQRNVSISGGPHSGSETIPSSLPVSQNPAVISSGIINNGLPTVGVLNGENRSVQGAVMPVAAKPATSIPDTSAPGISAATGNRNLGGGIGTGTQPRNNPGAKPWSALFKELSATTVNLQKVVVSNVNGAFVVPNNIVEASKQRWSRIVVCICFGPKVEPMVNAIKVQWGKNMQGTVSIFTASDLYYLNFSHDADRSFMLQKGNVPIMGITVVLREWTIGIEEEQHDCKLLPLWVVIRDAPRYLWNVEGISFLGSCLGNPLVSDLFVMKAEVDPCIRIKVEVSAESTFKPTLKVKVENRIVVVKVEYQWIPPVCRK